MIDKIHEGDALEVLKQIPDEFVDCCVTSPPYWGLRDYGIEGQIGLERTIDEYVQKIVEVFREVRRVMKKTATLWLNMGDSYASQPCHNGISYRRDRISGLYPQRNLINLKPKDLCGIPWRVAFALQADGWLLRSDIIWEKPNPMPESVTDRPTKAHEYLFLMAKSQKYFYDADAIREKTQVKVKVNWKDSDIIKYKEKCDKRMEMQGTYKDWNKYKKTSIVESRNRRSVWEIATQPFPEAHFATFPEKLVEPCILAGCPVDGTVLDPFMGSGTVAKVAIRLGRHYVGIELKPEYIKMAEKRLRGVNYPLMKEVAE